MSETIRYFLHANIAPIVDLVLRFYISYYVLIEARYLKVWENIKLIFVGQGSLTAVRYEVVNVFPMIPDPYSSYLSTGLLFIGSILLALGLFGRIGALFILIIYGALWFGGYINAHNSLIMLVLGHFVARGSGRLSMDIFFKRMRYMR